MIFKIYLRSSSKVMVERQKKREGHKYKKAKYLENKKSFLEEIKSIFHSFWKATIWWKNKNLMKIVDKSFKLVYWNKKGSQELEFPKNNKKIEMEPGRGCWLMELLKMVGSPSMVRGVYPFWNYEISDFKRLPH